ncbi:hypothetical protein WJX74_006079 [Apatococcus lobatus]|uniref:Transmembrane protein n=1 Tax=Apatococcus lobatus TaxID=904363 RepID=A0AAW1QBY3_9CHLO
MVNASKQRQRQRKKAQASAAGQAFAKAAQASQETSAPDSDDDQPDISTQTAVLNGKHTSNNGHITSHTTEHASAEEHGPSRSPDSTGKDESLGATEPDEQAQQSTHQATASMEAADDERHSKASKTAPALQSANASAVPGNKESGSHELRHQHRQQDAKQPSKSGYVPDDDPSEPIRAADAADSESGNATAVSEHKAPDSDESSQQGVRQAVQQPSKPVDTIDRDSSRSFRDADGAVSAPPAMPQGLDSPGPDQEAQSMAVPPVASSKSPMEKAQSEASPTSQEEGPPGTSSDVGQDVGPRSRSTAGFDPLGKMTNGRGSAHSSPGKKARAAAPEPGSESAAALAAALAWLSAPGNGNEADKAPAATSFGNLQEPSANQLGGQVTSDSTQEATPAGNDHQVEAETKPQASGAAEAVQVASAAPELSSAAEPDPKADRAPCAAASEAAEQHHPPADESEPSQHELAAAAPEAAASKDAIAHAAGQSSSKDAGAVPTEAGCAVHTAADASGSGSQDGNDGAVASEAGHAVHTAADASGLASQDGDPHKRSQASASTRKAADAAGSSGKTAPTAQASEAHDGIDADAPAGAPSSASENESPAEATQTSFSEHEAAGAAQPSSPMSPAFDGVRARSETGLESSSTKNCIGSDSSIPASTGQAHEMQPDAAADKPSVPESEQSDRQEGGRETPPTGPTADYVSEAAESQENLPATASDKASVSSEGIKAGAESYAGGAPRIAESLQQPEEPAKQANHSPKNQRGASLRQLEQMIRAQFSGSTPSSSGQGSVALSEPGTAAVDAQNPEPSQHAQQLKALEQQARGQFSGAAMPATSHSQNPKPSQLEALEKQVGGQFPAAGAPSKSKETTDGKSSHWREAEARARQGLPSADMAAVEAHRGPSKKAGKPALHKARRSGKHVHFNGESAPAPDDCQEESEVKKLTGQLEQIRNELHSAHEELHKARSQLQGVEKERDDMAGKLAAWEKRSSTLSGSQAKLESRVNDLQRQLARQRQDINAAAGGRPANNRLVWTFGTTTLASMAFAAYLFVRCVNGHPRSRL